MLPKEPKGDYEIIDTAGLILNSDPLVLINDPVFSQSNKNRLKEAILGKRGKVKGDQKDLRVIEYNDNPALSEVDSMDVLRSFMRLWSTINYYYPYKEKLESPWDSIFYKHLPSFIRASRDKEISKWYEISLYKLTAEINDSHVRLSRVYDKKAHKKEHREGKKAAKAALKQKNVSKEEETWGLFPLRFKAIDSNLYISQLVPSDATNELSIGDQVEFINGCSVFEMQARYDELYANSNSIRRNFEMNRRSTWYSFSRNDTLILKLTDNNTIHYVPRVDVSKSQYMKHLAPRPIKAPENNNELVYINIANNDKKAFKKGFKKSAKEDLPLIIDARDYPAGLFITLIPKYLSKRSQATAAFYSSSTKYPGVYAYANTYHMYFSNTFDIFFKMLRIYPTHWQLFIPLAKNVKAPVVVLIDEATMSWGETTVMSITAHRKNDLTLIGRNTAGANGNIGIVQLAGRKEMSFTRIIINDPENNNYQQEGIPPDIYVTEPIPSEDQTDNDIILQTALEFLREREKQAVLE